MRKRNYKVYRKFRQLSSSVVEVPQIKLEGKWLEDANIKIGDKIVVSYTKNKLILHKED